MVHSAVEPRWKRHLEPIERRERAYGRWYALTWSQLTGLEMVERFVRMYGRQMDLLLGPDCGIHELFGTLGIEGDRVITSTRTGLSPRRRRPTPIGTTWISKARDPVRGV